MTRTATMAHRFFFLTVLLVLAGWGPMAYAQILVTTTTDEITTNSSCSLREAITNANDNAATFADCATGVGTDTIILEAGKTYTLAIASTFEDLNADGDLDITDTAGLTIRTSLMFGTATIDADDIDRVFEMHEGPLTLIDLIIQNGRATSFDAPRHGGGGIRALDGDLTLTRCTVRDNETFFTAEEVGGGGIAVAYGSDLGTGGSGTLTIDESTIADNRSLEDHGGGLYASGDDLTVIITNSTISGNTAGEDFTGGGIHFDDLVHATIINSTIANNGFALSGDGFGGGIGFFSAMRRPRSDSAPSRVTPPAGMEKGAVFIMISALR